MTLIVDRKDIRELLHYFFRSRVVQYRVMGEFYRFFNTDRQSIEMDIEAIEKEIRKTGTGGKRRLKPA